MRQTKNDVTDRKNRWNGQKKADETTRKNDDKTG